MMTPPRAPLLLRLWDGCASCVPRPDSSPRATPGGTMLTFDFRRKARVAARAGLVALLAGGVLASACNGDIGQNGKTGTGGSGGLGGSNVTPGDVTVPPTPISQDVAYVAVRKVKNLLVGMPPTDQDVALVTTNGAAGLQMLVSTWQTT